MTFFFLLVEFKTKTKMQFALKGSLKVLYLVTAWMAWAR